MAELVDAPDLGSGIERCAGSSPVSGTPLILKTMNELKEKLVALGLSAEMADKVIATVADFVKSKIPASYHGMIDDVMAGKSPDLGGILGSLGGLFGK
jgi:hypothetical protein